MPKPRPSMMKRQREQAKRDKKALKAERKAQRKTESDNETPGTVPADDVENVETETEEVAQ